MKLYIVRHAWAGEHGDPRYPDDRLRPLTEDGRKRFAAMMKRLAGDVVRPTLIATSPLVRCRQTAEILAEHLPTTATIVERPELAPGVDLERLVTWTMAQSSSAIAWVGHAPDVGHMAARLIGNGTGSIRFSKGAICEIDFAGAVAPGRGELRWLVTAKSLGC
jgi:phosphohistidine phosphatase